MLRRILSCVALGLVAACAGIPRQTRVMSAAQVEMSTDELRQRVYELGHRQEGMIEEAVSRIVQSSPDLEVRGAAVAWGLAAIPAVQEATLRPDPLIALIDLWALAVQTRTWAREGPGRSRLHRGGAQVEQVGVDMARATAGLVALVFGPPRAGKVAELDGRVERWAAANPITSPTFARPSASVAWAGAFAHDQRSGPGSFVLTTDERLAALSQRVSMLNDNLLTRFRWTLDLFMRDSLGKENASALLEAAAHDLTRERQAAAADLARERDRAALQLEGERDELIADLRRLLDETDARGRALVDRALVGGALVGLALILVATGAFWIVRRATHTPPDRKRPPVEARAVT
jgi:hypothetical protein